MGNGIKDITGQRFGKLTAQRFLDRRLFGEGRATFWSFLCDCGATIEANSYPVVYGKLKSCGKCPYVFQGKDYLGVVLGTFVVAELIARPNGKLRSDRTWLLRCTCGHEVARSAYAIKKGHVPKCAVCTYPKPRGRLTPVNLVKGKVTWLCECGTEITLPRSSDRKSCGCMDGAQLFKDHGTAANKVFRQYQKDAERRGKAFELSESEFYELITSPCHYTGMLPSKRIKTQTGDFFWNGVDRKDNSLGYVSGNCLPCSQYANWAKERRDYDEFIAWFDEAAKYRMELLEDPFA